MYLLQTLLFATLLSQTLSTPLPQLAGEGSACNSLLSSTDNGIGYGIENAESNTASLIRTHALSRRQLAGEGAACNSLLSSTDNGVGYGVENAEENTAAMVGKARGRRQLDKISNGFQAIGQAAGLGSLTSPTTTGLDGIDGTSTSAAAALGAEAGSMEVGTLEALGSAIPRRRRVRRQGDKIANGAQVLGEALGAGELTEPATTAGDGVDGTSTSGAADLGASLGVVRKGLWRRWERLFRGFE